VADVRILGFSLLAITIDARSIVPVADAYARAGIAAPLAIARASIGRATRLARWRAIPASATA
jgi:hypothetical protein